MIDGLVISENKSLFDEINLNIASDISYFEYASSMDSAKKLSELDVFDYIILIEKDQKKIVKQLSTLKSQKEFENIPIICCTTFTDASSRKGLWEKGVKDICELPISKDELKFRLLHFFQDISEYDTDEQTYGMQGKLEDYNLLDIVQTLEQNKKTGILMLYHGRDEGKIWFHSGRICDAEFRNFNNLDAIFKMAAWMEGDFSISFAEEEYEEKIVEDNQQILIDSLQYIDKRNKILENLPDLHETLLISPETDMDLMDESDLAFMKFFQGGQTIAAYLFAFDEDELNLLERMKQFMDSALLMTREQFDNHMTEQEREIETAGIKNVFKKIFKGSSELKNNKKSVIETKILDETSDIFGKIGEDSQEQFEAHFNPQSVDINKIKSLLEKV